MIQVYKIPDWADINAMRQLKGEDGSYLNPIQDINGIWVISQEEWNAGEFQYLKIDYSDIFLNFELIEYNPVQVGKI